jgi:hypothetical protein
MSGTGGFQTQVYNQPLMAIAGDFASNNPWASFDAGPGALVAGSPNGVSTGLFAWVTKPSDPDGTPAIVQNNGFGSVSGFVPRRQQALITKFLANAGVVIPPGFQMDLMIAGDFWVVNNGTSEALPGQKCYATFANGQATFAAAGTPSTAASLTGVTISAATASVTGSITNDMLTVTAVGSGTLYPGATLSGTGVASGTKVVNQTSGTIGGVGVYTVSIPEQAVASTTITATYGLMTVGGVTSGTLGVGQVLTGTGVTVGTVLTAFIGGVGGTGTYAVDPTQAMSSSAVAANLNVETGWIAASAGAVGELVKISTWYGTGVAAGYVGFGTP